MIVVSSLGFYLVFLAELKRSFCTLPPINFIICISAHGEKDIVIRTSPRM